MARRYAVDTDDVSGRLVYHRPILASGTDAAVKEALARRYRLQRPAHVTLRYAWGHAEINPQYGRGEYEVYLPPFRTNDGLVRPTMPAFRGWFHVEARE